MGLHGHLSLVLVLTWFKFGLVFGFGLVSFLLLRLTGYTGAAPSSGWKPHLLRSAVHLLCTWLLFHFSFVFCCSLFIQTNLICARLECPAGRQVKILLAGCCVILAFHALGACCSHAFCWPLAMPQKETPSHTQKVVKMQIKLEPNWSR